MWLYWEKQITWIDNPTFIPFFKLTTCHSLSNFLTWFSSHRHKFNSLIHNCLLNCFFELCQFMTRYFFLLFVSNCFSRNSLLQKGKLFEIKMQTILCIVAMPSPYRAYFIVWNKKKIFFKMRIVALQIGQTFYDSFELHTGLVCKVNNILL